MQHENVRKMLLKNAMFKKRKRSEIIAYIHTHPGTLPPPPPATQNLHSTVSFLCCHMHNI